MRMYIDKVYLWSVRGSDPIRVRFISYNHVRRDFIEAEEIESGKKRTAAISDLTEEVK